MTKVGIPRIHINPGVRQLTCGSSSSASKLESQISADRELQVKLQSQIQYKRWRAITEYTTCQPRAFSCVHNTHIHTYTHARIHTRIHVLGNAYTLYHIHFLKEGQLKMGLKEKYCEKILLGRTVVPAMLKGSCFRGKMVTAKDRTCWCQVWLEL